jgi:hypothetical protein
MANSNDLIFSRSHDGAILTHEQIAHRAPAVFTTYRDTANTSEKYGQVLTIGAIGIMADHGWHPVQAAQKRSKWGAGQFAEHMLSFKNEGLSDNDYQPEVILYNSHNATSSLKLFCGAYRFICSNGIIVGEGAQEYRLRHSQATARSFEGLLKGVLEGLPVMATNITKMKNTHVSSEDIVALAETACDLRGWLRYDKNDVVKGPLYTTTTLSDMDRRRRSEDTGSDAWRVFNRIQEKSIRGGPRIFSVNEENSYDLKMRRAKAVASITQNMKINPGLWNKASQLLIADAA